jgi:hypothetical protein
MLSPRQLRQLLWDKVAAVDAVAAHVAGMVAPYPEEVVAAPLPAVGPRQHRTTQSSMARCGYHLTGPESAAS